MLPLIVKRAVILTVVCLAAIGMIVFYTKREQDAGRDRLRIGYVAEENMVTDMAVSYVQEMESVRSLYSLTPVSSEQEGIQLIEEGALSALVVLPEDIVNEILSGSNAPAKLYLPERSAAEEGGLSAVGGMLFQEFANAMINMLGTAQAEIYASSAILNQMGAVFDNDQIQSLYDKINQFNLGVVAARENLFEVRNLSVTENDTFAIYYGSAVFAVYMLLSGLFFGAFCKRSRMEQEMAAKKLGIGRIRQLLSRCAAGSVLMLVVTFLPFAVFLVPAVRELLTVEWSLTGVVVLLLMALFMTVYFMFIYELVEKRQSALLVTGLAALFQAYPAGCLVPSVLLPERVAAVGKWIPAALLKEGFTVVFTGKDREAGRVAGGLFLWGLLFLALTAAHMCADVRSGSAKNRAVCHVPPKAVHVPSVLMVMFRRLMHKKSIWVCMGLVAVLSVAIVNMEKRSETQITAAVYDESGVYAPLLTEYEGLVRFVCLSSEEAVKKAVLRGEAECGYRLPESLAQDMTALRANRRVAVYQDVDAVAVPIVNEVIFERIFRSVSLKWYEDDLIKDSVLALLGPDHGISGAGVAQEALKSAVRQAFTEQIDANATFSFETSRIGTRQESAAGPKQEGTYPVFAVAMFTVALCALQGLLQAADDLMERRFYKRNRLAMAALTVALPVMLGLLTGILTMALVRLC